VRQWCVDDEVRRCTEVSVEVVEVRHCIEASVEVRRCTEMMVKSSRLFVEERRGEEKEGRREEKRVGRRRGKEGGGGVAGLHCLG
jgi:hypothetical protein